MCDRNGKTEFLQKGQLLLYSVKLPPSQVLLTSSTYVRPLPHFSSSSFPLSCSSFPPPQFVIFFISSSSSLFSFSSFPSLLPFPLTKFPPNFLHLFLPLISFVSSFYSSIFSSFPPLLLIFLLSFLILLLSFISYYSSSSLFSSFLSLLIIFLPISSFSPPLTHFPHFFLILIFPVSQAIQSNLMFSLTTKQCTVQFYCKVCCSEREAKGDDE